MTEKQIVREFLELLESSSGNFKLRSGTVSYKALRSAIIDSIELALNDGYDAGFEHCDNMIHWDTTIFSRKEE